MEVNTSDLEGKILSEFAWRVGTVAVTAIRPHAVKAYSYTKPAVCVKASAIYRQLGLTGWILYLATVGCLALIAVCEQLDVSPPMWTSILPALVLSLGVWDACKAGSRRIRAATAGRKRWPNSLKRLPG